MSQKHNSPLPCSCPPLSRVARLRVMVRGFLFIGIISSAYIVYAQEPVNLDVIARIESSLNPKAIGDKGKAFGLYQLHHAAIIDYNRAHKTSYPHSIALNPEIYFVIASWYINSEIPRLLKHYKLKDTLSNRLTAWNMGIRAVIRGKTAHNYVKKYASMEGAIYERQKRN